MKNIRLGDVLIEFGYITPDQLNTALAYQKEHRDLRVGQALQELGYVNERQVLEALAQRLQLTMIDIEHTNVDVTAVEKVPQELAQKYDMMPIAQSPRALTIAANDPLTTINNLSDFVFSAIKAIGAILLGFGIVQIGLALKGHDASQRAQGFMTFFGGVVIYFAKDILDMIL